MTTAIRTRWAAVGAAVAVTLGAGGIGLVAATAPADAVTYVPITPCRLADTRPDARFNVGPRSTPIGADDTHVVVAHGSADCAAIPTTSTGLQLNVTALNATDNTFVTVWGVGARPTASSLNPSPGQPPAPNAVTTGLTDTGRFSVFNRFGTVDIIVDVVGYYTDHDHDDRYRTVRAAGAGEDAFVSVSTVDIVVASITVETPVAGLVVANSSAYGEAVDGPTLARCAITTGTKLGQVIQNQSITGGEFGSLSGTRQFEIAAGADDTLTINLVCDQFDSANYSLHDAHLTAIFTAGEGGS